MPELSRDGRVLSGVGFGANMVAVGGLVPPPLRHVVASGWRWIDADWIGGQYQNHAGRSVLGKVNVSAPDDIQSLADHGANFFFAGGGRWQAGTPNGCFGSWGDLPGEAVHAISDDGDLITCPAYHVGRNLRCRDANGALRWGSDLETGPLVGVSCDGGMALVTEDGRQRLVDIATGATQDVPLTHDGRHGVLVGAWIVFAPDHGLAIRSVSATTGLLLVSDTPAFYPDARMLPDGTVEVVYSLTDAEAPTDWRRLIVDTGAQRVRRGDTWHDAPVVDFTVPPMPKLALVAKPSRPLLFGGFNFDDARSVGNVAVPVRQTVSRFRAHPCVIPAEADIHLLDPMQEVYAIWAGEGDPKDGPTEDVMDRLREVADELAVGLVVYQDGTAPVREGVLERMRSGDIYAVQAYRDYGEPLVRFEQRIERQVAKAASTFVTHGLDIPIVLIAGLHKGRSDIRPHGRPDHELAEAIVVLSWLVEQLMLFGVLGFRFGLSDEPAPEVRAYWEAWAGAVTARPAPIPPSAPHPPAPTPAPTPVLPPLAPFPILETPMYALRDLLTPSAFNGVAAPFLSYNPVTEKFGYRPWAEAWEQFEVSQEGHDLLVRIVDADRQYAITEEGRDETRDVGTDGPFERSQGGRLPDGRLVVVHFNSAGRIVRAFEAIPFDSAPKKSDFTGVAA